MKQAAEKNEELPVEEGTDGWSIDLPGDVRLVVEKVDAKGRPWEWGMFETIRTGRRCLMDGQSSSRQLAIDTVQAFYRAEMLIRATKPLSEQEAWVISDTTRGGVFPAPPGG
ncbi:MAG: hypothetical protein K0U98_11470 [Deltaproteobacteria bacterium]|nr:hypothetical protein [Deltaproteobacteria bacterium]